MRRVPFLLVLVVVAACGRDGGLPIVASNVVVTAAAADMPVAAAYLDISNRSGEPLRITRVTSPQYAAVEMHETTVEDGVSRMREIAAVDIADGETVSFERGGRHLMLMRPEGTPDTVTLNFYSGNLLLFSVSTGFEAMVN